MEYRQPVPADSATPYMPPMPLANAGVTCWWNALLQTMLSLRRLTEVVLRYRAVLTASNPMAAAYIAVIDAHMHGTPIGRLHLDLLNAFVTGLSAKGKSILSVTAQECANEAFVHFIEMFSFDPIERMFLHVYSPTFTCSGCKKCIQQQQDRNLQIKFTPPIAPPGQDKESYAAAYRKFVQRLQVDTSEVDEYICEGCKTRTLKAFRISQMHAVHEIITLIFPQYDAVKRINWFPAEFRLSRAETVSTANGTVVVERGWHVYRVRSAMFHSGTMQSGHHYVVCERPKRAGDVVAAKSSEQTASAKSSEQTASAKPSEQTVAADDRPAGRYRDPDNALYRLDDTSVMLQPGATVTPSPYIHMVVYELVHAG